MGNKLKEGFLRQLKEQEPQEGWLIKWIGFASKEKKSLFTASKSFRDAFVDTMRKSGTICTIEPHTRTYK